MAIKFIKYNKANCLGMGSYDGKEMHHLRPGWNEFPAHIWAAHENDAEIKALLEAGQLEVFEEKAVVSAKGKKGKPAEAPAMDEMHIKDLDEKRAIEIVKGTMNRELLQRWIDEETRHKVKRALDAQIKPLMPESQAG